MAEFIRAKNYTDFAEKWKLGIPCFYTGWKSLKCDGVSVYLEYQSRSNLLVAEKVGGNFVLYNHRPKDYATDILRHWSWSRVRMPNLVYATLGKPKGITHDSWLSNQLYESLLCVATHLLHPNETIPIDEV